MKHVSMIIKIMMPVLALAVPFAASAHDEACVSKSDTITHVEYVDEMIMAAYFTESGGGSRKTAQSKKDRLHLKAMEAIEKLKVYKFDNAVDKLSDIYDNVVALDGAKKMKIDPDDADAINDAVIYAVECIGDL